MDAKELVRKLVLSSVGNTDCDMEKLTDGIDAYTEDNGFQLLDGSFDEDTIQRVVSNNLADRVSRPAGQIVLYFLNYRLIEQMRLINNKSLKIAKERIHSDGNGDEESIADIERQFEGCLREVYKTEGLQQMLQIQISEIILNLDFAKNPSKALSRRARDAEVIGK